MWSVGYCFLMNYSIFVEKLFPFLGYIFSTIITSDLFNASWSMTFYKLFVFAMKWNEIPCSGKRRYRKWPTRVCMNKLKWEFSNNPAFGKWLMGHFSNKQLSHIEIELKPIDGNPFILFRCWHCEVMKYACYHKYVAEWTDRFFVCIGATNVYVDWLWTG